MECVGGIDVDAAAIRDFDRLAGVPGTVMDLFSRGQYVAFHGHEPPDGWAEKLPADVRAAYSARPNIMFLSAPCKGFSGLTSESKSLTPKYQALNELTLRGVWLMLEAFADDPVEFILFENVPRIESRGAHLLEQIDQLLRHYGYAVAHTTHDCGKLGGLAQSRKRFLLVARHVEKVPPFLYEPRQRPLRGVGEVLGRLPMPGEAGAGTLHRLPALQWRTWVRLAFVEAGKDWRSLQRLAIEDGVLRDYGIVPAGADWHHGALGVRRWGDPSGTVTGNGTVYSGSFSIADPRALAGFQGKGKYRVTDYKGSAGTVIGNSTTSQSAFAVADPRVEGHHKSVQLGVRQWNRPAGVVTGKMIAGGGPHSVADPRLTGERHKNVYRVVRWDGPGPAVTGDMRPTCGGGVADPRCNWNPAAHEAKLRVTGWGQNNASITGARGPYSGSVSVADPRPDWTKRHGHLAVMDWEGASRVITGGGKGPQGGALSVADPRPNMQRAKGDAYLTAGHYGVVPWSASAHAVTGSLQADNGHGSVADIRLPEPGDALSCVIVAEDGTWHRPFTTLDMAALQSLLDPEEYMHFRLDGRSDSAIRERIGNAVPSEAAEAIGSVIARTLLLAWSGETFVLSSEPIWVREQIAALQCGSLA